MGTPVRRNGVRTYLRKKFSSFYRHEQASENSAEPLHSSEKPLTREIMWSFFLFRTAKREPPITKG
jgi:hypothetical protein